MTAAGTPLSRRVGEVVGANSSSFLGQCYRLYDAPPLGCLVRTSSPEIYGVVCRVSTEPLDPGRPILARGEDAESEDEVFRENPQLERLLTSRFETLIVGHQDTTGTKQSLPPLPPRVHSFIYWCGLDEIARFTASLDMLRFLVNASGPAPDEVLGAYLRIAAATHPEPREFLLRAGKTLAAELSGDLPRLNTILKRVSL